MCYNRLFKGVLIGVNTFNGALFSFCFPTYLTCRTELAIDAFAVTLHALWPLPLCHVHVHGCITCVYVCIYVSCVYVSCIMYHVCMSLCGMCVCVC